MTPIHRNLLYIFRGTLLRLRISWQGGNSITLSVGLHVDKTDAKGKSKWNGTRCLKNTTHGPDKVSAMYINRTLEDLESRIHSAFGVFENDDHIPTKSELKALIGSKNLQTKISFFDAYDEFLSEGIKNRYWTEGTYKKLKSRKNLLLAFDQNLKFKDLSKKKLNEFVDFQTKNCITKAKDTSSYINTTIKKNINLLKWFLRWASEKGYNNLQDFQTFTPALKTPEKEVIFLEWDELMALYNHDYSSSTQKEAVRDRFCFCCFTSLRYSDLFNLKKTDVTDDEIHITTIKTSDKITIDLNDYSRAILKKYSGIDGEKALPVISNQKMNDAIKIIAKECGIDTMMTKVHFKGSERIETTLPKYKLITTHCGRRTFICNALMLGIPPEIVMKWTGHSDYKAMSPYIAIADNARRKSMQAFNHAHASEQSGQSKS